MTDVVTEWSVFIGAIVGAEDCGPGERLGSTGGRSECGRHYADHMIRPIAKTDSLADNAWISGKAPTPQRVGKYDGTNALDLDVGGCDDGAESSLCPQ